MIFLTHRVRDDPEAQPTEEPDPVFAILCGWLSLIIVWGMAAYLVAVLAHRR